jgi:hypothetical protein
MDEAESDPAVTAESHQQRAICLLFLPAKPPTKLPLALTVATAHESSTLAYDVPSPFVPIKPPVWNEPPCTVPVKLDFLIRPPDEPGLDM